MCATKYDQQKPDLSLIPHRSEAQLALCLMAGAQKYDRNNYKAGFPIERLLAAAARHLGKMKEGELIDSDCSGRVGTPVAHAACVMACMAFILECGRLGTLTTLDHHPDILKVLL